MAYKIGDTYTLYKYPLTIYYSSDHAAKKNKTGSASTTQTGDVEITNIAWTDAAGNWYYPDQGAGTIPIYATTDPRGGNYSIGWIRSDENLGLNEIENLPTSFDSEADNIRFNVTKPVANSTYDIEIRVAGAYITTLSGSVVGNNLIYTWTFTSAQRGAFYSSMRNSTSARMDMKLITYVNGVEIGTRNYYTTININDSIKPRFQTNPTVSIVNPVGGKAYQDISSVKVLADSGLAGKGASLTSTSISVGDTTVSQNTYTTNPLRSVGVIPISVTITDSRSRTTTWTSSVTVQGYINPGVSTLTASRLDSDKTKLKLQAVGTFDNAITTVLPSYLLQYKEKNVTSYNGLTSGKVTQSGTGGWLLSYEGGTLAANKSYDIRLTITDNQGRSISSFASISTESVPFSWGKHGMAVGDMFDNNVAANLQVGQNGIKSKGPISSDTQPLVSVFKTGLGLTADLNTLIETGDYHSPNTYHNNIKNKPANLPGEAFIISVRAFEWHTFQEILTVSGKKYHRTRAYLVWSDWIE